MGYEAPTRLGLQKYFPGANQPERFGYSSAREMAPGFACVGPTGLRPGPKTDRSVVPILLMAAPTHQGLQASTGRSCDCMGRLSYKTSSPALRWNGFYTHGLESRSAPGPHECRSAEWLGGSPGAAAPRQ